MSFLIQFFESLKTQKIKYSVLRNYQQLPESTGGSDLDILINKVDSDKFISLIFELSKKYNGSIVSIISSDVCPRFCLLGTDEKGWGLMIDLHYDEISYRGYTILSNETVWKNTIQSNGISVLNNKSDALVGLFKELLNNRTCKKKYYDNFKKLALDKKFLDEVFISIKKPEITSLLIQSKNIDYSSKELGRLVDGLETFFPKKSFITFKSRGKFSRLFKQPGYTVAFLGTDGSGKSTIIEKIQPALNHAFHNAVYYEHMRPNKLPSIAKLMGSKEEFNGPVSNPHANAPSGFLGSLIRWFYYLLDYTFGFYLKVWPKKAIRSCIWIFDRYYYDNLIDQKRGRIKLPHWILKLGQFIVPEPDIILCLGANAEKIYNRKPELPLHEVERQIIELKKFCNSHSKAIWIDTGKNIEESSTDALKAILKVMEKRFEFIKLT